nr:MAG TPA: hypothetical protein [Caudoviricetes sp.]
MHFCSVLHFAKANHNRATICLSFAHLLYSAQFFAITTSFYSVPLLYFTFLFCASPIITTFSHAVAYFVISVHLKRPLPEFRH